MNISLILLVVWFMESSCGLNLRHKDGKSHGHLGISDIAIIDLNNRAGFEKWKASDMDDKAKAFDAAHEYIAIYRRHWWSLREILLLWRCGPAGMSRPSPAQNEYTNKAERIYNKLITGEWSPQDVTRRIPNA